MRCVLHERLNKDNSCMPTKEVHDFLIRPLSPNNRKQVPKFPRANRGGRFRGWSRAGHAPPRGAPAFRDDEHVQRRHQVAQRGLSRGGVRHERSRGGLFFEGRRRSSLERVAQRLERVAGGGRCEAKRLPRLRPPRERVAPLLLIMLLILVDRTNERPPPPRRVWTRSWLSCVVGLVRYV